MTIARDIKTNEVLGQVTWEGGDRENDYLRGYVRLLTRDGYVSVPESSVRLEEVSDR